MELLGIEEKANLNYLCCFPLKKLILLPEKGYVVARNFHKAAVQHNKGQLLPILFQKWTMKLRITQLPNGHKKQRLRIFSKLEKVVQKYQSYEHESKEVIPATK